ncbi:hypothetical protein HYFRA_00010191 [Hymenoscyphus fraxineus]|uniref:Uncharacterized protein n=1 Tax=Hymenoscyphus fraxineus TaxID=746836 RepID=A0A9N9KXS8_9HELO|nr:hypothetical protein HYFRA_00010191 [Hymenoscyphus fraxineus]
MSSHSSSPSPAPELPASPSEPFPLLTPEPAHRVWDPTPNSKQNGKFVIAKTSSLAPASNITSINCHLPMKPTIPAPPQSILQTPFGSEVPPSQDPCYFSLPTGEPPSTPGRQTQSDKLSSPVHLSPEPTSAESCESCPTPCSRSSNSSGGYLSPPLPQYDCEQPPHKPRSGSDGLKMMPKPKRARTMPLGGLFARRHEGTKKRRHHHRRLHKSEKVYNRLRAYSQERQTIREGYDDRRRIIQSRDMEFKLQNTPNSAVSSEHEWPKFIVTPPTDHSSRRWSSAYTRIASSKALQLSDLPQPGIFTDALINTPGRYAEAGNKASPDGCPGAPPNTTEELDVHVVHTIRDILTERQVKPVQLNPPSSITLTKPSSDDHRVSSPGVTVPVVDIHPLELTDKPPANKSCETECSKRLFQRRPTGTFLITSKDIQAIADLVEAEINSREPPGPLIKHSVEKLSPLMSTFRPSGTTVQATNLRKKCLRKHMTAEDYFEAGAMMRRKKKLSAQSGASVHALIWGMTGSDHSNGSDDEMPTHFDNFYRGFFGQRSDTTTTTKRIKRGPRQEKQEIIWKSDQSPISTPTACTLPKDDYFLSEPNTPIPGSPAESIILRPSDLLQVDKVKVDKATAKSAIPFDSSQLITTFFPGAREWTWDPPNTNPSRATISIQQPVSDTDTRKLSKDSQSQSASESCKSTKRKKQVTAGRRPGLTTTASQLADVVSFPPLASRKTTNDWYSPLPDIEIEHVGRQCQSLYDIGLDMTCGPTGSISVTTRSQSLVRPGEIVIRPPMMRSDAYSEPRKFKKPLTLPQIIKSEGSIKLQPKAEPKTGVSDETGSRLDVSVASESRTLGGGESTVVKRVRTIDSPDKGKRVGTWSQRRPPSVCPPPRPPSPTEIEALAIEEAETCLGPTIATGFDAGMSLRDRAPTIERTALLKEKSPQGPEDDCAGIYRTLTGTLGSERGGNSNGVEGECRDGVQVKRDLGKGLEDGVGQEERNPSVDWIA